MSRSLVLLTLRASPYIVSDLLVYVKLLKVPADKVGCPLDSYISGDLSVILGVENRCLEFIVV